MGDKLQIIKAKYQMALVSIREAEQERDDLKKQLEAQKEQSQKIEKSTKYLCETILKKKKVDDKEVAWFKLELSEMIKEAQSSIEQYFPSIQKMLEKLLENNSGYIKEIHELKKELEQEKSRYKELARQNMKHRARIEQLEEQIRKGVPAGSQNIVSTTKSINQKSADTAPDTETMEFIEESHESMKEEVEQSLPMFRSAGEIEAHIPKGPGVKNSEATKKATKETLENETEKRKSYVAKVAEGLNEQQGFAIQIIGETGFSRTPFMITYCKKFYPDIPSKSRIITGLKDISLELPKDAEGKLDPTADYMIEKRFASNVGGCPKLHVYRLSFLGEDIYRYLFNKDPKVSEMTELLRHHSSIEHGYGIANTAAVFKDIKFVKDSKGKVFYLTKNKKFIIPVKDDSSFIPDIVITYQGNDSKEHTEYIEYETGECNDTNFIKKCNKIGIVCRMINVIVPSKGVMEDTYDKALKWKKYIIENGYPFNFEKVAVRILSFDNLKKQSDIKSFHELTWDQIVEVRKKGGK